MRLGKANIKGLVSPLQQAEMKSILAGTWPPLKPLPVFKYETAEYRASIDFDKRRGEWVCRKTSLPSNNVQELRGGLKEITMALPHAEADIFTEGAEQQEHELERDTNRRLHAIHEWKENYENGVLYFELRDYLSERQRAEIDDSLRLSLTARQLQFNPKNVAYVFDVLSTAGGRFATLIEFAKRNKAKRGTGPQAQAEAAVPEAENAIDSDNQSAGTSSREVGRVLNNPFVRDQEAVEYCSNTDELPPVSIKNVPPGQDQDSLEEKIAHTAFRQFEIETAEIVDADSPSPVEHPHQEGRHSPALTRFTEQDRTGQSFVERVEGSPPRFSDLQISVFQVAVFASLFLFAVTAFIIWITVGRGPIGRHVREAPKSLLASDAKSPKQPGQLDESHSRVPTPPAPTSDDSARTDRPDDTTPSEKKPPVRARGPEYLPEARSADSDSARTTESKPSAKPEVSSEHSGGIGPIARNVSPPASSKPAYSPQPAGPISKAPRSPDPRTLTSAIGASPHLPRTSAILVDVPSRGSQSFKVSFPEKAIAASSSVAMTSQLSVLVSPEPRPAVGHRPARLEAGELVSFVWPRYPRKRDRYGLAEVIKVRATIGQLGQVLEVRFLSGSLSLLPATRRAVRQWRYTPTLLDKTPVPSQQDVTIEFRPPQYSPQVATRQPSHK